jgi:hypothetical protein
LVCLDAVRRDVVNPPGGGNLRGGKNLGDIEAWSTIVDLLSEQIVWDYDFALGDRFLDADPDESRAMMQEMGIQPDYFTEIAPDPLDGELDRAREILRQLTGRPQPAEQRP